MLEPVFGQRPKPLTPDARGDPTSGLRHSSFVEHDHHVRVFPVHASDRAGVAVEDSLVWLAELLGDHETAPEAFERPGEFGWPETGGGEDRDLGMGAADVGGAAWVATVGADCDRIVPREPCPGESQRDRRETWQDAQVLPAEPPCEKTHDAEESRVPRREHDHWALRVFDPV